MPEHPMTTPSRVLVLGIGNILWADEGFGVRAVEAFHRDYEVPANVTVLDGGTGFLFTDPRVDGGAHFDRILGALEKAEQAWPRPSPPRRRPAPRAASPIST